MGCDIHLFVEKKKWGKWVSCDEWREDDCCDDKVMRLHRPIYRERDYTTFAMLAGVRSWLTIDQKFPTKGFPKDASKEVRKLYNVYGGNGEHSDAHSASYLTLTELKAIDWTKEYMIRIYTLTERQFALTKWVAKEELKRQGKFVCGAWKPPEQLLVPAELYNLIKRPWTSLYDLYDEIPKYAGEEPFPGKEPGELKETPLAVPLNLICGKFYRDVVCGLTEYAEVDWRTDADNVRIVYWFDN
jgi:hypothetical protein